MKLNFFAFIIALSIALPSNSQDKDITSALYTTYNNYKEVSLDKRRIKHHQLQPLIHKYAKNSKFMISKVGESIEGRSISLISIGKGKTNVFLWSQMHGNEPTATQAIFDILNFLDSDAFTKEKTDILSNLKLHFLPMLNPDGAERYMRRNMLGIDINRDALRLQSPEGRILKQVRDSLDADFGFNLHDQSTYYNAERTNKPATISYLAPAYNYEKEINKVRGNAMKVIVFMNDIIQKYAKGQVGRYNDDFEPRAFGDNIQKWGTSAILIESGGNYNDIEKQEIRKLNYVSILSAIYTIANGSYKDISIAEYEKIPENDRKLFDLKLENITYNLLGKEYRLDLGIHQNEVDDELHNTFHYRSRLADQGDLSTFYGYNTLDATGYTAVTPKVYGKVLNTISELNRLDPMKLLKQGVAFVRVKELPKDVKFLNTPFNIISASKELPKELRFFGGMNPNFFLEKERKLKYAVINGFLINLENGDSNFKNALVLD